MIIRKPTDEEVVKLNMALDGREARFRLRESLPPDTIAWNVERLPLVLVSSDLFEEIGQRKAALFAASVLYPIREGVPS